MPEKSQLKIGMRSEQDGGLQNEFALTVQHHSSRLVYTFRGVSTIACRNCLILQPLITGFSNKLKNISVCL